MKFLSPASARTELRHATAAVHERLHRVPAFAALAAGQLDHAAYLGLLGRLYGFHDPFETAVAQAGPPGLQPVQWRRAHLLRSDMAALGWSDAAIGELPRHPASGGSWSPAHAMSCRSKALAGRFCWLARAELVAGAIETFHCFEAWFAQMI